MLYRSAGTLALRLGMQNSAFRLADKGLSIAKDPLIISELITVWEQALDFEWLKDAFTQRANQELRQKVKMISEFQL